MQSRLTFPARRLNWVAHISRAHAFRRGLSSPTSRTASPSIHAGDHENDPPNQDGMEPENSKSSEDRKIKENLDKDQNRTNISAKPRMPAGKFEQPKPARGPSSKLESAGVNEPLDPIIQQKREQTTALEDAICTAIDDTPVKENENGVGDERDYQEYYKHRKASPLAEIEVADTRKPISQATDTAAGSSEYGGGDVVGWKAEQLNTAEEALLGAAETWRRNAMEGDPNAPQSKVLRALLDERQVAQGKRVPRTGNLG